jgi:hypothetical protein
MWLKGSNIQKERDKARLVYPKALGESLILIRAAISLITMGGR